MTTAPPSTPPRGSAPPSTASRPRWSRIALAGGSAGILVVGLLLAVVERDVVAPFVPGGETCRVGDVRTSVDEMQAASTIVATQERRGTALRDIVSALASSERTGLSADDALPVARALTGRDREALTCSLDDDVDASSTALNGAGLTTRAAVVRRDLDQRFGQLPKGGFAPGGVRSGHMPGSAHYEGRAVDVFFRPVTEANKREGWAVAQYLVANAKRLDVATVIFDDRIWTTRRSGQGWRAYSVDTGGRSAATAAILEHRDHVHVDVFR